MSTLPPAVADRPMLGIAFRVLSATAFAGMAALLKAASLHGANTVEMVFYRNAGALPVVLFWAFRQPDGLRSIRTDRPMAHLTRSGIGLTTMFLTFAALSLLPLGEATTITYTGPIFGTILSAFVLRESVGRHRWAAVAAGFLGMALVARPWGGGFAPLGLAAALGAAIGQAGVMITLRQIGKSESPAAIVFWFTFGSTMVGAALLPFVGHGHDLTTYALLLGGGLFGGLGQIGVTGSLRYAPVATIAPFDYLQIMWATLLGWSLFGEDPTGVTLFGAAMIIGSGFYTAIRESRMGRVPPQVLAPPEG